MTKPIESFFDMPEHHFRLWNPPNGTITISQEDIIFQAPLSKISRITGQWVDHYFVLTKDYFYFLKSEMEPKILSIMNTEWVRCDYIYK